MSVGRLACRCLGISESAPGCPVPQIRFGLGLRFEKERATIQGTQKDGGGSLLKPPHGTNRHGKSVCPAAVFFLSAAGQIKYSIIPSVRNISKSAYIIVLNSEQICGHAWGMEGSYNQGVSHPVRLLRQAIEPDPINPVYIKTVYRVGYCFIAFCVETCDMC